MNEAASDVYEIVTKSPSGPKSWFKSAVVILFGAFSMGAGPANPGGLIISVVRKDTGEELVRHIEDFGDDEGYLADGIQKDLKTMTALEFEARWAEATS